MRFLSVLLLCLLSVWVRPALADDDMALRVEVERIGDALPFPHEMVLITIRGDYKIPITLENLKQPDFPGLDWMQLGVDDWFETEDRGRRVVSFERKMALFPRDSGTFEIGSFRHVLTLTRPNGERFDRVVVSEPVTLEVAELPAREGWWFPLRRIGIADDWSNAPQSLEPGTGVLRKIVLTVEGVQPEMIPPMPEMTGAGVAILPHPEVRRTLLRPRGPVTQVFWRWTIRPLGAVSGYVDPFDLNFFDALNRQDRTITISAQRVAYEGAVGTAERAVDDLDAPQETEPPPAGARNVSLPPHLPGALAAFIGLLTGGVLLRGEFRALSLASLSGRFRRWWERQRRASRLARAVRAQNPLAARKAAMDWLGADFTRLATPEAARLDRHLFAGGSAKPDLAAFARDVKARAKAIQH